MKSYENPILYKPTALSSVHYSQGQRSNHCHPFIYIKVAFEKGRRVAKLLRYVISITYLLNTIT